MPDPILQASGLTKEFAGFRAVDDVYLSVERGTIHALIGPNGAGKTTCFNLVTKFLVPTSGRLAFNGHDITRLAPATVARLGMVRSFQISATFANLTLLENVRLALLRASGRPYRFWRSETSLRQFDGRAHELLAMVNLDKLANLTAGELSYGRKRALEIVTTLALGPELLLLDEPTSGMGHEDIAPISDLIRSIARTCTVLMVEHNLQVVASLSDRITVLARGKVLAEGTYAEVSANSDVMAAYLGRKAAANA
ncbi:ABC transporter ATP-binding protein [Bradyrhizobium sp. LHD-71]|uniref:ABC transporter ATP-binding protein n=1 Tax=Bradyrhizobium sp. LHD-71 TaxID=3072141 RepID=UPI00280CB957|nr:ABC transporter ATP-binding protein [Bradyrhizobium sp. LHD-71]MDQ8731959.1 ABC transporter ATP-binding protein [Bradyrhizobium sp. LHD-71]